MTRASSHVRTLVKRSLHSAFGLFVVGIFATCQSSRPESTRWLESIQASHRSADDRLLSRETAAARATLVTAWDTPPPTTIAAEDARVVRQDIAYRLARIDMAEGRNQDALTWARKGLALGRNASVETANLLIVSGHVNQRIGNEQQAIVDLHDALVINDTLLTRALEAP